LRFLVDTFLAQLRRTTMRRANWYFSLLAEAIPVLGVGLYVNVAYPPQGLLYGYTRGELLTYYFVGVALSSWIPSVWYEVGNNIRTGRLNTYLLRPASYLGYFEARHLAVNMGYSSLAIVCVAVIGWMFPGTIILPRPSNVLLFLLSSACAFQLSYQVGYLVHLSAFWVDDFQGSLSVVYLFQSILSGQAFPLDFLPNSIAGIIQYTPFPYLFYEPLRVFLGVSPDIALRGIVIAIAWIAATGIAIRLVWNAGLKRYDARGG
jgi:ABC-2 type transport system permease protein